jgi:PleD family two-component response regulator
MSENITHINRLLIAVIDPDENSRLISRHVLSGAGYDVIEASDGLSGLAQFNRRQPDMVVLDTRLPQLDGFEVCQRLRLMPGSESIPILMISDNSDDRSIARAFECGATDYQTKPFNWTIILRRIQNFLKVRNNGIELVRNHSRILELLNNQSVSLDEALNRIAELAQDQLPHIHCGIMLLNHGRLYFGGAPSLPETLKYTLDGMQIGNSSTSTGIAAYTAKPVLTSNIMQDRAWEDYFFVAIDNSINSCWSMPVQSSSGVVLGVCSFYLSESRYPTPAEFEMLELISRLTLTAIRSNQLRQQVKVGKPAESVTRLPELYRLQTKLQAVLDSDRLFGNGTAVMMMELEGYNQIAHETTEKELSSLVAISLQAALRKGDMVVCLENGKFAVLVTGLKHQTSPKQLAERLSQNLIKPFVIKGQQLRVSANIGVSIAPADGDKAEMLLDKARLALSLACRRQGQPVQLFSHSSENPTVATPLVGQTGDVTAERLSSLQAS